MKVLVLWAGDTSANLGVRVLAEGMAALARQAWGEATEVDFQDYGPGNSLIGFGGRTILRDLARGQGPIKNKLRHYDVILDSGAGDSFADIYGLKRLASMNYAHRISSKLGIPVVLGPQTVGPFNTALGRFLGKDSISRMASVFPRDTASAEYATVLGRRADARSTDVVFALPQPSATVRRDVLVNVSGLLWRGDSHIRSEKYREQVHSLVEGLLSTGRQVSLLAHVLDNPTQDNDVPPVLEVAGKYGRDVTVLIPKDLSEARSMISSSEIVIGSRMHACLNALSTGVPAIPWAYSRKFAPLMKDLGWTAGFDLRSEELPAQGTLDFLAETDPGVLRLAAHKVRAEAELRLSETALVMSSLSVTTESAQC